MVSVFTCSYNKSKYVGDAIKSVLAQTFPDFEYWILENSTDQETRRIVESFKDDRIRLEKISFTDDERRTLYVESILKNKFYLMAKYEYIMALADDDILLPDCLKKHFADFEKNPDHCVNYHKLMLEYQTSGRRVYHDAKVIFEGNRYFPGCNIDGGAIMFRKNLLDKMEQPFFPLGWELAATSDGEFMNKLVKIAPFFPIDEILSIKRLTPISTHQKG